MPAGVPAKEQMRADVDRILRRAQHGKPIKRDEGGIIQWDTLPQLPPRSSITGPTFTVPKAVPRKALEYEYIPEPPLPKIKPKPETPPSPRRAKSKKKSQRPTLAASAPLPEIAPLGGLRASGIGVLGLGRLKLKSHHMSANIRRKKTRAPPEHETFLPLARTDESRKQIEAYFRRIADPNLVDVWLQSFDVAQTEVAKREARALAKQLEDDIRKRRIEERKAKVIGVAHEEHVTRTTSSDHVDQEELILKKMVEELPEEALATSISRTPSDAQLRGKQSAQVNWKSLKRFFRLKPQLEELRLKAASVKLDVLVPKLDNPMLRTASTVMQSGLSDSQFQKLSSTT